MKKWFFLACTIFLSATFLGCSSDKEYIEPQLDVTPYNINGTWRLQSWSGDLALAEGSYVYIEFIRKDRTYKMYQNLDSFSTRLITGSYAIEIDDELGAVIRGNYDYGNGDWNHRYIVSSLTAKSMTWIAKDDPTDISVYVRSEIPNEVLEVAK